MNYIALIKQFWQLRREVPFSSVEADLYFYLLEISNSLQWKNPFQQSNALIGATIGVSEKTLISARNRLKQHALIDFTPGVKRTPSTYRLLLLKPETGNTLSNTLENLQPIREECDSKSGSVSGSESDSVLGENTPDIIKHKLNKTKPNAEITAGAVSDPPALAENCSAQVQEQFDNWQTWAQEHAPRVLKMKVPLTALNLSKLVDRWGVKLLESVFEGMDNYGPLTSKNVNAYKTADAWCQMRTERAGASRKPNGLPVTPARTSDDTAALIRRQQTKEIE